MSNKGCMLVIIQETSSAQIIETFIFLLIDKNLFCYDRPHLFFVSDCCDIVGSSSSKLWMEIF